MVAINVKPRIKSTENGIEFFHEGNPKSYLAYYHKDRTHLGLDKDTPEPRTVQAPDVGPVVSEPVLGGLHHRYFRQAA